MNIEELLKNKSGYTLELKGQLPPRLELAKTICAFSNCAGGSIVIGVDPETKEITGIPKDKLFQLFDTFKKLSQDIIEPTPTLYANVFAYNEKKCFIITVLTGGLKPYYLKGQDKKTGTYIREGVHNLIASPSIVTELERQAANLSYDTSAAYELEVEDLDKNLIEQYLEKKGIKSLINYAFLENNKLIVRESGKIYPSISGVLCFSNKINEFFAHATIECNKYEGLELKESRVIEGNLIGQLDKVIKFFIGMDLPVQILKELVLNAIIHRDYSYMSENIEVSLYDDRLEVISPGALPVGISINSMNSGMCSYRNANLYRIFSEITPNFSSGSGIQNINKLLTEQSLNGVKYEQYGNKLIATVSFEETEDFITKEEQKVLTFLETNDYITNNQCQKLLKMKGKQVQYILTKLTKRKKVSSVGEKKGRRYFLEK